MTFTAPADRPAPVSARAPIARSAATRPAKNWAGHPFQNRASAATAVASKNETSLVVDTDSFANPGALHARGHRLLERSKATVPSLRHQPALSVVPGADRRCG